MQKVNSFMYNPGKQILKMYFLLVAVVVVLGPEEASVGALCLRLRGGGGGGGRLRPPGPPVLTDGRHEVGALDDLPVADVLVAMHVGTEPGPIIRRVVQI